MANSYTKLFYIVQAILVFYEVHDGFGKTIDEVKNDELGHIQRVLIWNQRCDRFLIVFSSSCTPTASSTSSPCGSRRYQRHFCTYDYLANETIE